jgi:hypothetical protein
MTPREYAEAIVIPTAREFRDERCSPRLAFLACMVTYHLHDHIKAATAKNAWLSLQNACPDEFEIVQAVCNGAKHGEETKTEIKFKPGREYWRPPAVAGLMVVGLSAVGDHTGGVEIYHNGRPFDIYWCIKVVLKTFVTNFPRELNDVDFNDC